MLGIIHMYCKMRCVPQLASGGGAWGGTALSLLLCDATHASRPVLTMKARGHNSRSSVALDYNQLGNAYAVAGQRSVLYFKLAEDDVTEIRKVLQYFEVPVHTYVRTAASYHGPGSS